MSKRNEYYEDEWGETYDSSFRKRNKNKDRREKRLKKSRKLDDLLNPNVDD